MQGIIMDDVIPTIRQNFITDFNMVRKVFDTRKKKHFSTCSLYLSIINRVALFVRYNIHLHLIMIEITQVIHHKACHTVCNKKIRNKH